MPTGRGGQKRSVDLDGHGRRVPDVAGQQSTWRKSSFTGNNGQCVEIAELPGGAIAIRDSKSPHCEPLRFTSGEWAAFLNGVHAGEFG